MIKEQPYGENEINLSFTNYEDEVNELNIVSTNSLEVYQKLPETGGILSTNSIIIIIVTIISIIIYIIFNMLRDKKDNGKFKFKDDDFVDNDSYDDLNKK